MIREYATLLMFMIFVVINGIVFIALSHLMSHHRPTAVKGTPYESGMPPLGSARERFSVKFYLVAMLFIVFDLETVFMYPWAQSFRQFGLFGLIEMGIFMLILAVGYVYIWKRGAFEWE
jgi:NADH-quinone oxidoreductase subunit A